MKPLLVSLTDEQGLQELVPGKNRGIYLVGHLLAHHDNLNTLLGLGRHPELDEAFMHHPEHSGLPMPAVRTLVLAGSPRPPGWPVSAVDPGRQVFPAWHRLGGRFPARALP